MILFLLLAAQATSGKLPPAQILLYEDPNVAPIMAPINALVAAFDAGDRAAVLRLIYPYGRVTATGTRGLSGSGLRQQSWTEFAERIKPDATFQESISDPAIETDGDAAMVWASYVVRVGGKVTNCGFDHFDLVRENGAWKIMNLTFSAHVTGCPQD